MKPSPPVTKMFPFPAIVQIRICAYERLVQVAKLDRECVVATSFWGNVAKFKMMPPSSFDHRFDRTAIIAGLDSVVTTHAANM